MPLNASCELSSKYAIVQEEHGLKRVGVILDTFDKKKTLIGRFLFEGVDILIVVVLKCH